MFESMTAQIPAYKKSKDDWSKSDGNVAACIIDDDGNIYGKIWGSEKIRGRRYFDIAYRKASQVSATEGLQFQCATSL